MKLNDMLKIVICSAVLALYGCGGGGGGTSTPTTPTTPTTPITPTTQNTTISGTASAAPISGGDVTVYKITGGTKGDQVGTPKKTGADGKYTIDIGTYTGPVMVEISGGSYTDEATGMMRSIPADAPLHALLANATGNVTSAVTPLTELAYQTAGSYWTPAVITASNTNIGDMFKISDIIASQPVAPIATELNVLSLTSLSEKDQYNYTLALAALSQLSKDLNKSVAETVTYIQNQSSVNSLNTASATAFQTAVTNYFKTGNATGVTDPSTTALVTVGGKKAIVTLLTSGTLSGASITGIEAKIVLPSGVTVKSDSNTGIFPTYLYTLGAYSNYYLGSNGNGNPVIINLGAGNSSVSTVGAFATLECDVAYYAPTPLGNFTVSSYKITGLVNGNTVDLTGSIAVTTSFFLK